MTYTPAGLPALSDDQIRTPLLPFMVGLELQGYTLITYMVPPEQLRRMLPEPLEPVTTEVNGHETAWMSLFIGRNVLRTLGLLPALPFVINQLNYRAYVKLREGHGLFIFRSVVGYERLPELLDGPLSLASRMLFRFPAHFETFRFEPQWAGDRLVRVSAEVGTDGSELSVVVESTGQEPLVAGFALPGEAVAYLGDIPEAYLALDGQCFRQLLAPHPPLRPEGGRLVLGSFGWLAEQGLLPAEALLRPAGIFMQGHAPFPTFA